MNPATVLALVGAVLGVSYGAVMMTDAMLDLKAAKVGRFPAAVRLTRMRLVSEISRFLAHMCYLVTAALVSIPNLVDYRDAWVWFVAAIPWILVASSAYSHQTKRHLLREEEARNTSPSV